MFFTSINEINSLRKEINRLLSKEINRLLCKEINRLLSKRLNRFRKKKIDCQVKGNVKYLKSCCNLKIRGLGAKLCVTFLTF